MADDVVKSFKTFLTNSLVEIYGSSSRHEHESILA